MRGMDREALLRELKKPFFIRGRKFIIRKQEGKDPGFISLVIVTAFRWFLKLFSDPPLWRS
jgi:hypothetical protein